MDFKNFLVVRDYNNNYEIWTKKQYETYVNDSVEVGACSAYKIITQFDGSESLLDESPNEEEGLTIADYKEVIADHKRLVREIDVILNGEGAALQASLIDLVDQIRELKTNSI